jgi:hypothetical protein
MCFFQIIPYKKDGGSTIYKTEGSKLYSNQYKSDIYLY